MLPSSRARREIWSALTFVGFNFLYLVQTLRLICYNGCMASKEEQWALYGIHESLELVHIEGPFELVEDRRLVALFSSEAKARAYVDKSRLKNPQRRRGFSPAKVFRKASLLSGCSYAEIERHYPDVDPPVDPE
jgi:hypothetical protein